jgi:hypothetical protein
VVELSRHVFEVLRSDKDFILYRGRRENDESHVLVLSPVTEYPAPEILKWLEHAFSLREQLDPTWAARPMAIAVTVCGLALVWLRGFGIASRLARKPQ